MAIPSEKCDKIVPQVLTLAEENGLRSPPGQVYLPPRLAAKQDGDTPQRTIGAGSRVIDL
jgi:hypothetical protein